MLLIPLLLTFLSQCWNAQAAGENGPVSTVISTGGGAPLPPPGAAPPAGSVPPAGEAPAAGVAPSSAGDPNKPLSSGPPPGGFPGASGQPKPNETKANDERKIEGASLYSYKDAEGNLKIVDSLDAVPAKYRDKAKPVKKKD